MEGLSSGMVQEGRWKIWNLEFYYKANTTQWSEYTLLHSSLLMRYRTALSAKQHPQNRAEIYFMSCHEEKLLSKQGEGCFKGV